MKSQVTQLRHIVEWPSNVIPANTRYHKRFTPTDYTADRWPRRGDGRYEKSHLDLPHRIMLLPRTRHEGFSSSPPSLESMLTAWSDSWSKHPRGRISDEGVRAACPGLPPKERPKFMPLKRARGTPSPLPRDLASCLGFSSRPPTNTVNGCSRSASNFTRVESFPRT